MRTLYSLGGIHMTLKKYLKLLIILGSSTLIIITSVLWVYFIYNSAHKINESDLSNQLSSINSELHTFFTNRSNYLQYLLSEPVVHNIVDDPSNRQYMEELNQIMRSSEAIQVGLIQIVILNHQQEVVYSSLGNQDFLLPNDFKPKTYLQVLHNNKGSSVSTLMIEPIINEGYVAIEIDSNALLHQVDSSVFSKQDIFFIADQNGDLLLSNLEKLPAGTNLYEFSNQGKTLFAPSFFTQGTNNKFSFTFDNINYHADYDHTSPYQFITILGYDSGSLPKSFLTYVYPFFFFSLGIAGIIILLYYFSSKRFLKPFDEFTTILKDIKKGDSSKRYDYTKNTELGIIVSTVNDLLDQLISSKTQLELKQVSLDMLQRNIPGGLYKASIAPTLDISSMKVIYSSAGLFALFDIPYDEQTSNEEESLIFNFIHPSDLKTAIHDIEHLNLHDTAHHEFRIMNSHGEYIWVGQYLKLAIEDNQYYIYGFIIDISKEIEQRKQFESTELKYQMILEQVDAFIFEWNLDTHQVLCANLWNKGISITSIHDLKNYVLPTSLAVFDEWLQEKEAYALQRNDGYEEQQEVSFKPIDVEVQLLDYAPFWINIKCYPIDFYDHKKLIVSITNIDHYMKEKQELTVLTQTDLFTQLINKKSYELMINQLPSHVQGYFVIIDIDDFKHVNDNYGHEVGDLIILNLANALRNYMSNAFIGRIGGDEFSLFSQNKLSLLQHELTQVKEALEHINDLYRVTLSVGIYHKEAAEDFHTLYTRADEALYMAKKEGKNSIHIYNQPE